MAHNFMNWTIPVVINFIKGRLQVFSPESMIPSDVESLKNDTWRESSAEIRSAGSSDSIRSNKLRALLHLK